MLHKEIIIDFTSDSPTALWRFSPRGQRIILVSVLLLGILVRTIHLLLIDINKPFILGGLYYEFAAQISNHRFALPVTIPHYSASGIPFAYPPLAFYIEALFIHLMPRFVLANLLPALFACISLVGFAFLARQYFREYWHSLTAILIFALLGSAFSEQIEAAGLVESLGTVWLVGITYILLKSEEKRRDAVFMGVFTGLGFVTSPGIALGSVFIGLLYALKHILPNRTSRSQLRIALLHIGLASGIMILVILPYIMPVIAYHGLSVFTLPLTSKLTSSRGGLAAQLVSLGYMGAYYPWLWQSFFVLGVIWTAASRRWLLLAWTIALMLIPQEGVWMSSVPIALVMTGGVLDILGKVSAELLRGQFSLRGQRIFSLILISFCLLFSVFNAGAKIERKLSDKSFQIVDSQLEAVSWIQESTPPNSNIIIFSNSGFVEWSPQLLQRTVLNVGYGQEFNPHQGATIGTFLVKAGLCKTDLECYLTLIDKFGWSDQPVYLVFDAAGNQKASWRKQDLPPEVNAIYGKNGITILKYTMQH
jgi:hypothetical protein